MPHIGEVIQYFFSICLQSVWHSLGLSMLLHAALFHSLNGWVIFHCICVPHLPYPAHWWWTSRWLPRSSYCKHCSMTTGVRVPFWIMALSGYMPRSGVAGSFLALFILLKEPPWWLSNWPGSEGPKMPSLDSVRLPCRPAASRAQWTAVCFFFLLGGAQGSCASDPLEGWAAPLPRVCFWRVKLREPLCTRFPVNS